LSHTHTGIYIHSAAISMQVSLQYIWTFYCCSWTLFKQEHCLVPCFHFYTTQRSKVFGKKTANNPKLHAFSHTNCCVSQHFYRQWDQ